MLNENYILIQPIGFQSDATGVPAHAVLRSVVLPVIPPAGLSAVTVGGTTPHSSPPPSGGFCP